MGPVFAAAAIGLTYWLRAAWFKRAVRRSAEATAEATAKATAEATAEATAKATGHGGKGPLALARAVLPGGLWAANGAAPKATGGPGTADDPVVKEGVLRMYGLHMYLFLLLTYLVLPPVSLKLFQALDCITVNK